MVGHFEFDGLKVEICLAKNCVELFGMSENAGQIRFIAKADKIGYLSFQRGSLSEIVLSVKELSVEKKKQLLFAPKVFAVLRPSKESGEPLAFRCKRYFLWMRAIARRGVYRIFSLNSAPNLLGSRISRGFLLAEN